MVSMIIKFKSDPDPISGRNPYGVPGPLLLVKADPVLEAGFEVKSDHFIWRAGPAHYSRRKWMSTSKAPEFGLRGGPFCLRFTGLFVD
jgi:hypothetical protein